MSIQLALGALHDLDMSVTASHVASYLAEYTRAYREGYGHLTSAPPTGAGYPALMVSPFLAPGVVNCAVCSDGAAIYSTANEPAFEWWLAGGPTLLADYEPTLTPSWVTDRLKAAGIWGKPIGIYRLVSKTPIAEQVWNGRLVALTDPITFAVETTEFHVIETGMTRSDVLQRLTFGVLAGILDVKLPDKDTPFWFPHIIRRTGFATADRQNKRYFDYLELVHHSDEAAWDIRAIPMRVQSDVRRDFGWAFGAVGRDEKGGSIAFETTPNWTQPFIDRLTFLASTLQSFDTLLNEAGDEVEALFHNFIAANPILLDVYGDAIPKPRWHYPEGESPLGKTYVEPDWASPGFVDTGFTLQLRVL